MVEPFRPALPSEPPPDEYDPENAAWHLPVTWPADGPRPVTGTPIPSQPTTLQRPPFGPGSGKPFGRR
jgi:hypothetical protein